MALRAWQHVGRALPGDAADWMERAAMPERVWQDPDT